MPMDSVAVEAVTALEAAVGTLLPAAVPPSLTRRVRVLVTRIRSAGLGGYVGQNPDPAANLFARRVDARIEVSIAGGADDAAFAYGAQLASGMLAQARADLARQGILRLRGMPPTGSRDLAFDIGFEYIKVPTAGEAVIDSLDLNLYPNTTPYRARFRWDFAAAALAGQAVPLAEFLAVDDPDLDAGSPAGNWSFQTAAPPCIVQTTAARGGALALTEPRKAGTQLLWRPKALPLALPRMIAVVDFDSSSPDGVGLVFGRKSANDFWFFLASQQQGYHVFGRRTPAAWSLVGTPAAAGFSLNVRQRFVIGAYDRTLFAELGGNRTLSVTADETVQAGEIGLLTHGNGGARFFAGQLIELA